MSQIKYLAIVVVAIGFVTNWTVSATKNENGQKEYCDTMPCLLKGLDMKHSMNKSIDPCTDFYQFACGSFMARHSIAASASSFGIFDIMEDKMSGEIKNSLEMTNKLTNATRYAKRIYSDCISYGTTAEKGLSAVQDLIHNITGGWKIGKTQAVSKPWYEQLVQVVTAGSISPIFNLSVVPDPKNSKANIVSFNLVPFTIGDTELKDLDKNSILIDAYRIFIAKGARLISAHLDELLLQKEIEEIVQLESSLAKIKISAVDRQNPMKVYHKMSIQDFSEQTKFDWLSKIIEPMLTGLEMDYKLANKTQIIVEDPNYYAKAISIVEKLQPKSVDNYFGWKLVEDYSRYSSQQWQRVAFEFDVVMKGVKEQTELSKICFGLVNQLMPIATSRIYVEDHFTSHEKEVAKEYITEVHESYLSLIKENKWLDEETRNKSLEKLQKTRINVAYPEWLLVNQKLDQYFGLHNNNILETILEEKNFLIGLAKFRVNLLKLEFGNLFKPVDIDLNWGKQPAVINAAYKRDQNSITIPAGILKSPFFNTEMPASVNFGAIGMVAGHEFTHGMDDKGSQYDLDGNLNNWWTEQARKRFQDQSQCYVEQYSAMRDETVHMNINGKLTLAENIADNGGIREAFRAYKNYDAKHSPSLKIAAIPAYNSDQLFFISYAQCWCELVRPELQKILIEYDGHSPGRFRVNVPLSNSADFQKAFHCPAGSNMNPNKKCQLW